MQKSEPELKARITTRNLLALGIILGGLALLLILLIASSGRTTVSVMNQNVLLLIPASFLAGVLSFLSPCTLPLLPAYFAFSFQASKSNVVVMTIAFFLGLATTMTVLGATATALSLFLFRNLGLLTLVGGWIIIIFGIMSLFGFGFTGVQFQNRPEASIFGSYVYGATFSLGWSACVGPILGAILTMLATQGAGILQGAFLAFIYALGLGLPLLLVAAFFSRLGTGTRFWKFLRGKGFTLKIMSHELFLHSTSILSGALLIIMGALLASGRLTMITQMAASSNLSYWVVGFEQQLRSLMGLR
jgi:cytochrome c-type biogenesis protein